MIKVLLKKQLQEFSSRYLVDTKTKKLRSKGGMIGMLLLMAFLFVVLMGSFGMFSLTLAGGFIEQGRDWMFFALQGVFALFMGVLGSVFTTFQTLFQPKDNELLLSMPIKPRDILLTRMVGVYLMAFLYSGLVLIPSTVVYWILAKPGMGVVLSTLLLWFVQALFTTVLTCGLGYVIALIASKIKGKSAVTVILSLLFIGGYYYVYGQMQQILEYLVLNGDRFEGIFLSYLWPFAQFGQAAMGQLLPMLITLAMAGGLLSLTVYLMGRSFIAIATTKESFKVKSYRAQGLLPRRSIERALLYKELKRFTSSSTYMLNSGLGLVLVPMLLVVLLLRRQQLGVLISSLYTQLPYVEEALPVIAVALVGFVISMNLISLPSISLEGQQLWILRSAPAAAKLVLKAKLGFHLLFNGAMIPIGITGLWLLLSLPISALLPAFVYMLALTLFWGALGLVWGLKHPNFNWTNEAVVVKQDIGALVCVFGGMALNAAVGIGGFLLAAVLPAYVVLSMLALLFAVLDALLLAWLFTKGVQRWDALS